MTTTRQPSPAWPGTVNGHDAADVVWHPTPAPRALTEVDANRALTAADAAPRRFDEVALYPMARRYAAPSSLRRIESRAVTSGPRRRPRPHRLLIAGAQRREQVVEVR